MAVKFVFLGKLADLAGTHEFELTEADGEFDWTDLLAWLEVWSSRDLAAAVAGEKVRIAVNGALLGDKKALSAMDGDEVAFLPPVSGG
ncbi:MAG: molybdopterin synthase sulfur carrier subunit [Sphingomonadales bacterium 63-6]|nr:MAG: molybdopterin synthase sulfur carrier subunit [Sphingomonadales bacterium 63-6]